MKLLNEGKLKGRWRE